MAAGNVDWPGKIDKGGGSSSPPGSLSQISGYGKALRQRVKACKSSRRGGLHVGYHEQSGSPCWHLWRRLLPPRTHPEQIGEDSDVMLSARVDGDIAPPPPLSLSLSSCSSSSSWRRLLIVTSATGFGFSCFFHGRDFPEGAREVFIFGWR